jgi:cation:H+ antiporter
MEFVLIISGLVLLIFGGDYLVKGASGMALKLDIPPMLVGMTVVALGTSSPELVVSLSAALEGKPDITVGNVVGSNIANVALILGVTTLIFPIAVQRRALKVDWTVMMAASVLFFLAALDGSISRFEGGGFVILLAIFIGLSFYIARRNKGAVSAMGEVTQKDGRRRWWVLILFVVLGTTGLVFGARWFLDGAESIARNLGVSDRVIAITLVAFGTSVPELAASAVASFKKEADISLGNILGSNLFNLFAIIGITTIVSPVDVNPEIMRNDIYWMLATSFVILPLGLMGYKLNRIDGLLLLGSYLVFVYILFINP